MPVCRNVHSKCPPPGLYYCKRFTRAACRRHASSSGGAPAHAKYMCTRPHTRTHKSGSGRRRSIATHDRLSHARRLASLARSPELRSPDGRRPGQGLPRILVRRSEDLGCEVPIAVRIACFSLCGRSLSLSLSLSLWLAR